MPKLNQGRSVRVEANLARRIAYEREQRGLSYEALADAMTKVGCAINASSIYKIEKGDPPRRISVDELAALAEVFQEPVPGLLVDMELIHRRKAQELIELLSGIDETLGSLLVTLSDTFAELMDLAADDPELGEYVQHQVHSRQDSHAFKVAVDPQAPGGELVASLVVARTAAASHALWQAIFGAADLWDRFKRGEWSEVDQAAAEAELEALQADGLEVHRGG